MFYLLELSLSLLGMASGWAMKEGIIPHASQNHAFLSGTNLNGFPHFGQRGRGYSTAGACVVGVWGGGRQAYVLEHFEAGKRWRAALADTVMMPRGRRLVSPFGIITNPFFPFFCGEHRATM